MPSTEITILQKYGKSQKKGPDQTKEAGRIIGSLKTIQRELPELLEALSRTEILATISALGEDYPGSEITKEVILKVFFQINDDRRIIESLKTIQRELPELLEALEHKGIPVTIITKSGYDNITGSRTEILATISALGEDYPGSEITKKIMFHMLSVLYGTERGSKKLIRSYPKG